MLSIDDIEVPAGMLEAVLKLYVAADPRSVERDIRTALFWLSANPIAPSEEEFEAMGTEWDAIPDEDDFPYHIANYSPWMTVQWQRRMFLKKPDPLPEGLKNLLFGGKICSTKAANDLIATAYSLGKKDGAR